MYNHWKELNRAIKCLFPKKWNPTSYISKDAKTSFMKVPEQDSISLIIKGIDNGYGTYLGNFHWEIYLNKDGTWKIV